MTAGFFELHLPPLVLNVASLLWLGRRLEPVWGHAELLRFCLLVNGLVGLATFCSLYGAYLITRDTFYLFARVGGFQGVIAGLLVALRQARTRARPQRCGAGAARRGRL